MEQRGKQNFFQRYISKLPFTLILLLAGLLSLAFFGVLAHEVLGEKENGFDQSVFRFLETKIVSPQLTPVVEGITFFSSQTFLLPAYILLIIFCWYKKQRRRSVEILLIGALGQLLNYVLKAFYHRTRPTGQLISPLQNFSFPSGHAMSAFIFYGLLIYLVWTKKLTQRKKVFFSTILFLIALAVGFSRVYLRVHYPSDVLAGFCLGFAWICFAIWILEKTKNKARKETNAKPEV